MTRTRRKIRLCGGSSFSPCSVLNCVHYRSDLIFIYIKLHQAAVSKRSQRRYEFWALTHPSSITNTPVSRLNSFRLIAGATAARGGATGYTTAPPTSEPSIMRSIYRRKKVVKHDKRNREGG